MILTNLGLVLGPLLLLVQRVPGLWRHHGGQTTTDRGLALQLGGAVCGVHDESSFRLRHGSLRSIFGRVCWIFWCQEIFPYLDWCSADVHRILTRYSTSTSIPTSTEKFRIYRSLLRSYTTLQWTLEFAIFLNTPMIWLYILCVSNYRQYFWLAYPKIPLSCHRVRMRSPRMCQLIDYCTYSKYWRPLLQHRGVNK